MEFHDFSHVFPLSGRFKTRSCLNVHRRITHNSRQFNCTQCDKSFKSKLHLNRHSKRHAEPLAKPFSCDMCEKAYTLKTGLKVLYLRLLFKTLKF